MEPNAKFKIAKLGLLLTPLKSGACNLWPAQKNVHQFVIW